MDVKEFPKEPKPKEIFTYACARIAEPLAGLGFKYRKSKNDIVKTDAGFTYKIYFQPSVKYGSTTFAVHIAVESEGLALWRASKYENQGEDGVIIATTLARLTKRVKEWPWYHVETPLERERSISEIVQQINEFALPFFQRFSNIGALVAEVQENGFLPHRKNLYGMDVKKREADFVAYFGS